MTSLQRMWTVNDTLYAELDGLDYVEVTSAKAPPSFLTILIDACVGPNFASDCIKDVVVNSVTMEPMTRSNDRLKLTIDADWRDTDGKRYNRSNISAIVMAL